MTTSQYLTLILYVTYRKLGRMFGAKGSRKAAAPKGEREGSDGQEG